MNTSWAVPIDTEFLELARSDLGMRRADETSTKIDAEKFADFFRRAHERGAIGAQAAPKAALARSAAHMVARCGKQSLSVLLNARVATLFAGIESKP